MDIWDIHMVVSKNRGTPKWMVYNGKPLLKWMIWGYHYFWKHPYINVMIAQVVGSLRVERLASLIFRDPSEGHWSHATPIVSGALSF